jgi:hypothetical protein
MGIIPWLLSLRRNRMMADQIIAAREQAEQKREAKADQRELARMSAPMSADEFARAMTFNLRVPSTKD